MGELKIWSEDPEAIWKSVKYKAHNSVDVYDDILWPEKFPKARLARLRQMYADQGDLEGYSKEYLNNPIDDTEAYFKEEDFIPISDNEEPLDYYVGIDLAISEKDRRAYTAMGVAGINSSGKLKVVDMLRYRSPDAYEHINNMFILNTKWSNPLITIEEENIARSIGPVIDKEQRERGVFMNFNKVVVTQDKIKRARSLQARMRAGAIEFNTEASWYPALYEEMKQFPKGRYSDQVDALAHICLALDKMVDGPTREELLEEEYQDEMNHTLRFEYSGRSAWTGY
jgi:predicted phage terminase large subunit-like protein